MAKTETMNILETAVQMPVPPIGGIEKVVHYLSGQLQNKGHKVTILACDQTSCIRFVEKIRTVYTSSFLAVWPDIALPRDLRTVATEVYKCDLVHIHAVDSIFGVLVFIFSLLMRKTIVVSVLSYLGLLNRSNLLLKISGLLIGCMMALMARLSDAVHVKNVKDYSMLKRIKKETVFIPDGIPQEYFVKAPRKLNAKTMKIVLYVGRLHKLKGPQVLLRAIPYLVEERNDIKVIMVGPDDGYKRKLLEIIHNLQIEKYVTLTEQVDEKELLKLYDIADTVVIPSLRDSVEAYSLVASEAWARRKMVVASRVGALKLRVSEGSNGYLFHPGDAKDLTRKIILVLDHNPQNFKLPTDVLDWGFVADRFQKIYSELLYHRSHS